MKTEAGLGFAWPDRAAFSFVLPAFLLISGGLHALGFYLLQVKYPPAATTISPPVEINLLLPTPENENLLRWIEAEDPAVGLAPESMPFAAMLEVPYRPSFAEGHAQPRLPRAEPGAEVYPAAQSSLAALTQPAATPAAPARPSSPTTLLLSAELQARLGSGALKLAPARRSAKAAGSTRYFLGVDGAGQVRFCFLQASSGSDLLDPEGEKLLRALPFSAADGPIVWGFATLTWGADAFETSGVSP